MTEPLPGRGATLPRHVRLMMRLSRRDLRNLPPPEGAVRVDAGLAVPAADGVPLITDHYIPQVDSPRPTVLVRTPYGRSFPWDHLFGGLIAEQGFHVVIQSCRGTGGSGGEYEPFRHERADGRATVAWLRGQPWFTGALAKYAQATSATSSSRWPRTRPRNYGPWSCRSPCPARTNSSIPGERSHWRTCSWPPPRRWALSTGWPP